MKKYTEPEQKADKDDDDKVIVPKKIAKKRRIVTEVLDDLTGKFNYWQRQIVQTIIWIKVTPIFHISDSSNAAAATSNAIPQSTVDQELNNTSGELSC